MEMKYAAGFAGAGHMGRILAAAVISAGGKTAVTCRTPEHGRQAAEALDCSYAGIEEILKNSRFVFLGMRPQDLEHFAEEHRVPIGSFRGTFVSMLAGVSIARLKRVLGAEQRIIRIMPNTPSAVGKGLVFCTPGEKAAPEETAELMRLLGGCGMVEVIPEEEMDAVSVLAGCGPAYVYAYGDALAKAGERIGLGKEAAVRYAAQMMLGSAQMMLETQKTPEELKQEVCSPGGTTIEGVRVLQDGGLGLLVEKAVEASFRKTKGM